MSLNLLNLNKELYIEIDYFGHALTIPADTTAIAMNEDENVYVFQDDVPVVANSDDFDFTGFWTFDRGQNKSVAAFEYTGNWRESLIVLKEANYNDI